jgi:hypothetical protein
MVTPWLQHSHSWGQWLSRQCLRPRVSTARCVVLLTILADHWFLVRATLSEAGSHVTPLMLLHVHALCHCVAWRCVAHRPKGGMGSATCGHGHNGCKHGPLEHTHPWPSDKEKGFSDSLCTCKTPCTITVHANVISHLVKLVGLLPSALALAADGACCCCF